MYLSGFFVSHNSCSNYLTDRAKVIWNTFLSGVIGKSSYKEGGSLNISVSLWLLEVILFLESSVSLIASEISSFRTIIRFTLSFFYNNISAKLLGSIEFQGLIEGRFFSEFDESYSLGLSIISCQESDVQNVSKRFEKSLNIIFIGLER